MTQNFEKQTKELIDDLKSVCANYGLGNDGNEFKIITQVFLYKFLNDKFIYEVKRIEEKLNVTNSFEDEVAKLSKDELEMVMLQLGESTAVIYPEQLVSSLYHKQDKASFAKIFDDTLLEIAKNNSDIFSVLTSDGEKIVLFENISKYVTDKKDDFCKAIVNKLTKFSFENIFNEKFDFFATIFEYLIKDYNTNSGGKYAEYFTPHAVAKIMAKCLVSNEVSNVTCYDPSAGSGTLLMNLAHEIGEDKCTILSQDISQKSSGLLRLNLILNDLVHSIHNIIKGNTILEPFHKNESGKLRQFDYIVSNPPFKLDFSDYRDELDSKENKDRFFAGVPKIPPKKKESMAIYSLFLQHIIYSLGTNGKAAIVVPTGFITAQSGIELKIRKKLVDECMLSGVVCMPSNIFATTGTSVSILFLEKGYQGDVVLVDAAGMGTKVKNGGYQRTVLSDEEENKIIQVFKDKEAIEDFSSIVDAEQIKNKKYVLAAGQYYVFKIERNTKTPHEFENDITERTLRLSNLEKANSESVKQLVDRLAERVSSEANK